MLELVYSSPAGREQGTKGHTSICLLQHSTLMKASIAAGWSYLIHKAIDYQESQSEEGSESSDDRSDAPRKKRKLPRNIEGGKESTEEYMRFQDGTKLIICMVGKPARKVSRTTIDAKRLI